MIKTDKQAAHAYFEPKKRMKATYLVSPFYLFSFLSLVIIMSLFPLKAFSRPADSMICSDDVSFIKRRLDSDQQDNLCQAYKGKVLLVVNTASRCGFTDQYDDLEKLYTRFKDQGLVVIGFPSNDFGNQEPGDEKSIKSFCRLTYGVQFPMYEKTRVKGEDIDPFYQALIDASGQKPRWNFYKYLIDREGRLVDSYSSFTNPQSDKIVKAIEKLL